MKFPLITITICTFNGELYLADTIESVLKQSYPNIEIIIVDDGSTDSTLSIIKKYQKRDSRIRFFVKSNRGFQLQEIFHLNRPMANGLQLLIKMTFVTQNDL